jgi:hypothetical protein
MSRGELPNVEEAILSTLAYFDVFDYPLQTRALHRYLHGLRITAPDMQATLNLCATVDRIESESAFWVLPGRTHIVEPFKQRRMQSRLGLRRAMRHGGILGGLPYIRMVAVTGSVSMENCDSAADYDYLLVTARDRLWVGRAFAILFGRWTKLFGYTLCPNVVLSERALVWRQQDLYLAHELAQMIPVTGLGIYSRMRSLNRWSDAYLPNARGAPRASLAETSAAPALARFAEQALNGNLGGRLEMLEMRRKIARFTAEPGYGVETAFTADICQGNFQHHGQRILEAFQGKLNELGLDAQWWTNANSESSHSGTVEGSAASPGGTLKAKPVFAPRSAKAPAND